MTKRKLIKTVAREAGLTEAQARQAVDALLEAVCDALQRGDEVRLPGLGIFRVVETRARPGRHPRTGAPIQLPAGKRPVFRAGAALVAAVKLGPDN